MSALLAAGFVLLLAEPTPRRSISSADEPRSAAPARPAAADDPRACASCHPAEHAEWRGSRHAAAWVDPVFQAEFDRGRPAWCVGCHAPAAPDPLAVDDADPRVARGVGCEGCHRRGGRMVSARVGAESPHDTIADPEFGGADFCAGCHEFRFPVLGRRGVLVRYTDEPMQATVSQWRRSDAAAVASCAACHAATPAGHAFPGSHDLAQLAAALDLSVCRERGRVVASLTNRGAGHNVPSGGVHRRLVIRAWRSSAPERMVESVLGRRFRPLPRGGKQTLSDTTLAPGQTHRHRVRPSALGGSPAEPIQLEVRYVYALDERMAAPAEAVSQAVFHRGFLPAELPRCRPTTIRRAEAESSN
jgi:hypothetical protein